MSARQLVERQRLRKQLTVSRLVGAGLLLAGAAYADLYNPGERAITGALVGAGTGAVIGAIAGRGRGQLIGLLWRSLRRLRGRMFPLNSGRCCRTRALFLGAHYLGANGFELTFRKLIRRPLCLSTRF